MENKKLIQLSIIIPCYNCISTLEEALQSIYIQNLDIPYEVIMIDDGSTDDTKNLIIHLSQKYEHIKYFYHEKNRGGGATRNTGIKKSSGKLIFILDSDDKLPANMLPKLIDYQKEKQCDGVVFSEIRYFYGNGNNSKTKITKNYLDPNKSITFSNLFIKKIGFLTLCNFLYTKNSYLKTNGYPENHGFDTQCFGSRYLANNLKVFMCPDSYYHHRRAYNESYYIREYKKGEISKNYYLIYENLIYLFSTQTIKKIINFDIIENSKSTNDIKTYLNKEYEKDSNSFFNSSKYLYMAQNGFDVFYENHKNSIKPEDIFCLGIYYYKNKKYKKSINCYNKLLEQGIESKIIYFNLLRSSMGLSGNYKTNEIENRTNKLIKSLSLKKHPNSSILQKIKLSFINRLPSIYRFLIKIKLYSKSIQKK